MRRVQFPAKRGIILEIKKQTNKQKTFQPYLPIALFILLLLPLVFAALFLGHLCSGTLSISIFCWAFQSLRCTVRPDGELFTVCKRPGQTKREQMHI